MIRRQTIIFALAALALGCGSRAEVARAKHSLYDTEFAIVYSAALDATRKLYPSLDDNPGAGAIKTAWHQVSYANTQDDLSGSRTLASGSTGGIGSTSASQQVGMPTRLAYKRFFIRFDVTVLGGRPWRVKVIGHAAEWEPGAALPVDLTGAAKPPWLDGRTDALTLAIYKRMKRHAVTMKDEVAPVKPEDLIPKTDPKGFDNVPAAAANRLALVKDAVTRREYSTLRAQLFDDVAWSLGGAPDADTAMAMWQADPETLDAMARSIGIKCASAGDAKVACPGGEPRVGQWQLILELRGNAWKVASFVKKE